MNKSSLLHRASAGIAKLPGTPANGTVQSRQPERDELNLLMDEYEAINGPVPTSPIEVRTEVSFHYKNLKSKQKAIEEGRKRNEQSNNR